MSSLLGLTAEEALARLQAENRLGTIILSKAPRDRNDGGTLRVVREQGDVLTVCAFPDGIPVRREEE